jgi:DnaJ-domain-containing protein 1
VSYSYLFKKAGRILQSYLNSAISGDRSESEKQRKIFEEYFKQEAYKRSGTGYRSETGSQTGSQYSGSYQKKSNQDEQKQQTKSYTKSDEYYYKILEVNQNFTNEEIKKAYKQLIIQYHPDKTTNLGIEIQNLAKKKTQEINEAYNFIRKKRNF